MFSVAFRNFKIIFKRIVPVDLVSAKGGFAVISTSILSIIGFLVNLNSAGSLESSNNFSVVILMQALLGLCSSFIIYAFDIKLNCELVPTYYKLIDRLILGLLALMLLFYPFLGIMLSSVYIGLVLSLNTLLGISTNQATVYILFSFSSSFQLILGSFSHEYQILRIGLLVCLLIIYIRTLDSLSVASVLLGNRSDVIAALWKTPLLVLVSASMLNIALPLISIGTNYAGQIFSLTTKTTFVVENLLNSRVAFSGDIRNSLNALNPPTLFKAFALYAFTIFLTFFLVYSFSLNARQSLLYESPDVYFMGASILVASMIRLFFSRVAFAYNFMRHSSCIVKPMPCLNLSTFFLIIAMVLISNRYPDFAPLLYALIFAVSFFNVMRNTKTLCSNDAKLFNENA